MRQQWGVSDWLGHDRRMEESEMKSVTER